MRLHHMYYLIMFYHFSCFFDHIGVWFGVFLGPIFAIILFNIVVFVLVVRVLVKHSRRKIVEAEHSKRYKSTLRALISIVSIMLMFGLSWLFGAFTISGASIVFSWLFVIFNSLQGFFLFLFFCVVGKDARDEWKSFFTCGRSKRKKRRLETRGTIKSRTGQSGSTADTYLTSRRSDTIRKAVQSELDSSTCHPLELSAISPSESVAEKTLFSIAEETVIENGFAETGSHMKLVTKDEVDFQPPDSQVPPHVFVRLHGPYYPQVEEDDSFPDLSGDLTQTEIISSSSDESDREEMTKL